MFISYGLNNCKPVIVLVNHYYICSEIHLLFSCKTENLFRFIAHFGLICISFFCRISRFMRIGGNFFLQMLRKTRTLLCVKDLYKINGCGAFLKKKVETTKVYSQLKKKLLHKEKKHIHTLHWHEYVI